MSTLMIELPDGLVARSKELPPESRTGFVSDALREELHDAIAEALYAAELEANFDPVTDAEECRLGIEEGLADFAAGRDISFEESQARWAIKKEALLQKVALR